MGGNQSVYASGNYLDQVADGVLNGSLYNTIDSSGIYLTAPWSPVTSTIPPLSAADAYSSVVASAGAWPRDNVDTFAVSDVTSLGLAGQLYKDQNLTGLPNDGYGTIAGGTPFPGAGSAAEGGLMLSSTGSAGTSFVALMSTGSGGLAFVSQTAGGSAQGIKLRHTASPVYLKIVANAGSY